MKNEIADLLMHGTDWQGEDVTGWFATEKFDGIRCLWTGSRLLTREGHELTPPKAWLVGFPENFMADGELWAGAGQRLARLSNVHRWAPTSPRWERCGFIAFDAPALTAATYSKRHEVLRSMIGVGRHGVAKVWTLLSMAQLARDLKGIQSIGGEGLMLREPSAPYTPGRTRYILKLKRLD